MSEESIRLEVVTIERDMWRSKYEELRAKVIELEKASAPKKCGKQVTWKKHRHSCSRDAGHAGWHKGDKIFWQAEGETDG